LLSTLLEQVFLAAAPGRAGRGAISQSAVICDSFAFSLEGGGRTL
jgi:hypothetical protein